VGSKHRGRAIVLGASLAGLATARMLADTFADVVVVDRDTLPGDVGPRKGVPQGRHAHALLSAGANVIIERFPGVLDEIVEAGASTGDQLADGRWWQFGGYRSRRGDHLPGWLFSRPLLETKIRARVEALSNVELRPQTRVTGLLAAGDRVRGVATKNGTESELSSELVVDCTGRGSQAARWLERLGYPQPKVSQVHIDMGYTTRLYRRSPGDLPGALYAITVSTPPTGKRIGVLFPVEGDRWMATMCGFHGDHAPTDQAGFLAWAEGLPAADIADVIRDAEPIGDAVTHRLPSNQRRHFEKLRRHPRGFVALGDAICSFNPIYGQGMTSALLQSQALAEALAEHDTDGPEFVPAFYRKAAKVVGGPWQIAAGADFMMPETTGPKPPGTDLVNRYLKRVFVAAQVDPEVASAVARVQNLLAPPPSLMKPAVMLRVARAARRAGASSTRARPTDVRSAPASR
jgi:2-polyprenyl-6-methoxyphenol hydroxylase-like FAD-dependent oxidoreductase